VARYTPARVLDVLLGLYRDCLRGG
jgi:hypothetical protein